MSPPPFQSRGRCFLHPNREAAARCMGCGQAFCRECVSEHDLQMLCADCLRGVIDATKSQKHRRLHVPAAPFHIVLGILILWFTIYLAGRILTGLPSDIHDGKLWREIQNPSE